DQRDETAKKSAEPRETKPAEQLRPGVGEELGWTLQHVIQTRADQACDPGDADDQEAFVLLTAKARNLNELLAAAIEIGLPHVRGNQQRRSDHQTERRNGQRTKVEEWNHVRSKKTVYMRAAPRFALARR